MTCIDGALGDALSAELLDVTVIDPVGWPVVTTELFGIDIGDDRWPHELWQCLAAETSTAAYLSVFAHAYGFADRAELEPEIEACFVHKSSGPGLTQAVARVLGSEQTFDGGYVLTNHHVLWPFDAAMIVFSDGAEYIDVPVAVANPWADIAVAGPLEPTITRGILSRVRHWEGYDLTLLQTDAAITGDQSGGALLDSRGCVIGVSTWSWTDAGFALSMSASDDAELIDLMLSSHEYGFSILDRLGDDDEVAYKHRVDVAQGWERPTYAALAAVADDIDIELLGPDGAGLWIADAADPLIDAEDALPRRATVARARNIAFVEIVDAEPDSTYTLSSSVETVPCYDEDGSALAIGRSYPGFFDYHLDEDIYTIKLRAGDAMRVRTGSVGADTYLTVYDRSLSAATYDDSGPVTFPDQMLNAEVTFEATTSGTYYIDVGYHPEWSASRSYLICIEPAP